MVDAVTSAQQFGPGHQLLTDLYIDVASGKQMCMCRGGGGGAEGGGGLRANCCEPQLQKMGRKWFLCPVRGQTRNQVVPM